MVMVLHLTAKPRKSRKLTLKRACYAARSKEALKRPTIPWEMADDCSHLSWWSRGRLCSPPLILSLSHSQQSCSPLLQPKDSWFSIPHHVQPKQDLRYTYKVMQSYYWLTPTELFTSWVIRSQQPKSRGDILNSILIVVTRLTQKLFCYSLFSPVINSPTEAAKNKDSHKGLRQDAIVLPIFQRVRVRCISKS